MCIVISQTRQLIIQQTITATSGKCKVLTIIGSYRYLMVLIRRNESVVKHTSVTILLHIDRTAQGGVVNI